MTVLAVRGYRMTPYGKQTAGEVWADVSEESPTNLFPRLANQTRGERDEEQGRKPAKRGGESPRDLPSQQRKRRTLSGNRTYPRSGSSSVLSQNLFEASHRRLLK